MKTIMNSERKFVVDGTKDFHSEFGVIQKEKFDEQMVALKSAEFYLFDACFLDIYEKIKRRAQIITLKDIGIIVVQTGMNMDSIILEAGSGSGALGCFLAHLCKKVISYDIREDHLEVAMKNAQFLGLKNIEFKIGDVREELKENNVDVAVLDMPDPWNALGSISKALKRGAFLVVYSPTIPQVMDLSSHVQEKFVRSYAFVKTLEVIEREWEVSGRKVRPKSSYINHTGFINFLRRI